MSGMTTQIIVPAYVWTDDTQRTAVAVHAVSALVANAKRHGVEIVGDPYDATVQAVPLEAHVGHAKTSSGDVAFVAYEPCEPGLADLVFVMFTCETTGDGDAAPS